MTPDLSWLPELVLLDQHDGNWDRYLEAIYQHFTDDFINSKPNYPGKRFALKRHPVEKGKEATFWHLISEGSTEAERLPVLRRCERIRWPRPIIEAMLTSRVRCWKSQRRGETRVVLSLHDFSYVVVLADRESYILLWTAFYVEYEHRKEKLRMEFERSPKC